MLPGSLIRIDFNNWDPLVAEKGSTQREFNGLKLAIVTTMKVFKYYIWTCNVPLVLQWARSKRVICGYVTPSNVDGSENQR